MARRTWRRYRPPGAARTEDGRPQQAKVVPPRPSTSAARRSQSSSVAVKERKKSRAGWWLAGIATGVVVVPTGIVAIAKSGEDTTSPGIATELINTEFIGESLELAMKEEGDRASLVRFDEYELSVEYFDPTENQIRTVETDSYTDGYNVRVQENHYDDYRPEPFDLGLVEPAAVVTAVEDALTRVDDPYSFSLRIEPDRETGQVTMVTYVSGDEAIDVVADMDGEFIEVD